MLPIHEIAADLKKAASLPDKSRILLTAPTGSGKSTEVPGMLADLPEIEGRVIVIEPRRMAARLLAGFVAKNRKTNLGQEVGYAVRFDTKYSDQTKILYLTDGVFQRILHENPTLTGVSAVIFDEFHERRLAVDIALGRCLDLQENDRPDLRVVVMSATLETGTLADYMSPVKKLEAGGRTFPVEILHRPHRLPQNNRQAGPQRETPIWEQATALTREALSLPDPGNILIFLPGTHEIRRTIELLQNLSAAKAYDIFPLYSSLPPPIRKRPSVLPTRRRSSSPPTSRKPPSPSPASAPSSIPASPAPPPSIPAAASIPSSSGKSPAPPPTNAQAAQDAPPPAAASASGLPTTTPAATNSSHPKSTASISPKPSFS